METGWLAVSYVAVKLQEPEVVNVPLTRPVLELIESPEHAPDPRPLDPHVRLFVHPLSVIACEYTWPTVPAECTTGVIAQPTGNIAFTEKFAAASVPVTSVVVTSTVCDAPGFGVGIVLVASAL